VCRLSTEIDIRKSLPSSRVIAVLERPNTTFGLPRTQKFDSGPEFARFKLARWAADRDVELHFIDAGKSIQNGHVERFNGPRLRNEA
jgi:putative transposase